jgi:hypothetical protein
MSESRRDDWLAMGEQYAKIDGLLHTASADHVAASVHHLAAGTMDGVTGVLFGLVRTSFAQYWADCDARERPASEKRRVRFEQSDSLFSDGLPLACPPTLGEERPNHDEPAGPVRGRRPRMGMGGPGGR